MSKFSYLQLNDNELVGTIPAELGKLTELFELRTARSSRSRAMGNALNELLLQLPLLRGMPSQKPFALLLS